MCVCSALEILSEHTLFCVCLACSALPVEPKSQGAGPAFPSPVLSAMQNRALWSQQGTGVPDLSESYHHGEFILVLAFASVIAKNGSHCVMLVM